ncbi:MAG: purine/pyrimidine permease [Planctomycetes bacterium]|nr:purine/pyrimidine permease [Planctomycetota bacterium]MCB9869236.1 purine/pyrimidine permease [Planctomycetota bacterium]MCB9889365.1 purine/pyrimidine permease [Planctomycetota bacterium]
MFGSTVAIPLLLAKSLGIESDPVTLGMLISTMFFVSGITTLLQTTWGNRLPLVQGGTFSFLAPTMAICSLGPLAKAGFEVRIQHVQGAVILSSLVEIAAGYSGLVGKLLRFLRPITIAPTVVLIGLALFRFGAPMAGRDWWTGGLTIGLIVLFSQLLSHRSRLCQMFPILLGIGGAWAFAALMTWTGAFPTDHPSHVSLQNLAAAPWFRVPYPLQWGWPQFGAAAFLAMLSGVLASIVESVGDYHACARMAGAPPPTARDIDRGIGMEGIGCLVAGLFGTGNGTTSYSENIGAIGLTKVGSRRVVQCGALLMLGLATFGKFGGLFTTIPSPIVGGMYCVMFGMIAGVGLSNLQAVDLDSPRNLFVLGFALFMGLSVPEYVNGIELARDAGTLWTIVHTLGKTGMAVGALCALVLDNLLPE